MARHLTADFLSHLFVGALSYDSENPMHLLWVAHRTACIPSTTRFEQSMPYMPLPSWLSHDDTHAHQPCTVWDRYYGDRMAHALEVPTLWLLQLQCNDALKPTPCASGIVRPTSWRWADDYACIAWSLSHVPYLCAHCVHVDVIDAPCSIVTRALAILHHMHNYLRPLSLCPTWRCSQDPKRRFAIALELSPLSQTSC
jgi:hypothetical protein